MLKMPCDCVYHALVLKFCVWYTKNLLGGGRGREQHKRVGSGWKPDDDTKTTSDWLVWVAASTIGPHHSQEILEPPILSSSNCGTLLCFLDSTMQNQGEYLTGGDGPISPTQHLGIIFNILNVINSVGPKQPTRQGLSTSKYAVWERF